MISDYTCFDALILRGANPTAWGILLYMKQPGPHHMPRRASQTDRETRLAPRPAQVQRFARGSGSTRAAFRVTEPGRVKLRFDEEGITIPFSRRDVHVKTGESATAPLPR